MIEGIRSISDVILANRKFLVTSHVFPDGDSIGSMLALMLGLVKLRKQVIAVCPSPVPETYTFLPGSHFIKTPGEVLNDSPSEGLDLAIVLDCSDPERAGSVLSLLGEGVKLINIDHHTTNKSFGSWNYVDVRAGAVGEQIYRLLRSLRAPIDKDMATCLFTAIATDTGFFRFANTTVNTFDVAGKLTKLGATPSFISERVYETKPYSSLKLLGEVLSSLELSKCGRVAWVVITRRMMEEFNVDEEQTEGFVTYGRTVKGVEVSVLFRETQNGEIRVAFRSRNGVDVDRIASAFGGGGHPRAAGCALKGSLDEVKDRVLTQVFEKVGEKTCQVARA